MINIQRQRESKLSTCLYKGGFCIIGVFRTGTGLGIGRIYQYNLQRQRQRVWIWIWIGKRMGIERELSCMSIYYFPLLIQVDRISTLRFYYLLSISCRLAPRRLFQGSRQSPHSLDFTLFLKCFSEALVLVSLPGKGISWIYNRKSSFWDGYDGKSDWHPETEGFYRLRCWGTCMCFWFLEEGWVTNSPLFGSVYLVFWAFLLHFQRLWLRLYGISGHHFTQYCLFFLSPRSRIDNSTPWRQWVLRYRVPGHRAGASGLAP
jgi:hypothetical protein